MIALVQRVSSAAVSIGGVDVAAIDRGMLALIGVKPTDDAAAAERTLTRLLSYRMFADDAGKMNLSLLHINGGLLLVPQFTLAADTRHGLRPGFSTAAPARQAHDLFATLVSLAEARCPGVQCGRFGADMQVSLVNDGPVTFWLDC